MSVPPHRGALLALAAAVLAAAPGALAQSNLLGFGGGDNGKPIGIEAERGVEWQQANHVYIARGNAKATRGDDTVYADTLYAYYRPAGGAQAHAAAKPSGGDPTSGGTTEIYRLEADGHVRFATPTETVSGEHAVYDVDQAILVMTGTGLKLETPRDTVTARDSLEWHDKTQTGVARGDAVAVRGDRRVKGDILTALIEKPAGAPSHIAKIGAYGNVLVTGPDQIARGDRGVYNLDTGIATLRGHVRLTRGDNELRGQYGVVDLNNDVSRLLAAPPDAKLAGGAPPRVEGLLAPRPRSAAPAR